jgi:hypothetical protein
VFLATHADDVAKLEPKQSSNVSAVTKTRVKTFSFVIRFTACVGAISQKRKEIGNPFLGESTMHRNTLLRITVAAAIGVSIFASVAYALTWVELRSGTSSALSGTRPELK